MNRDMKSITIKKYEFFGGDCMGVFEVIVYSSLGCPYCEKVKKQLKEWNIEYEERNVSLHKQYFDELRAKKVFGTPATYVNGKLILGFQEKKFKKAFGLDEEEKKENSSMAEKMKSCEDEIFEKLDQNVLEQVYDIVIIGSELAGSSAAVYAAREKLNVLVIDIVSNEGTLGLSHKIGNYPGIREVVTYGELLRKIQVQAKSFSTKFVRSNIVTTNLLSEIKEIIVSEGLIKAKSIFIAGGFKAPLKKVVGEDTFLGSGVSYCRPYDFACYEDKVVAVVGGNDEAIEEALTLSKFCNQVYYINSTALNDDELVFMKKKANVNVYDKHSIKEIKGNENVESVVVIDDQCNEKQLKIDEVFLFLDSLKPNTDFLKEAVNLDERGFVIVDDLLRTNVPGVFAGGKARNRPFHEVVNCAADGASAVLAAKKYLFNDIKLKPQF